MASKKIWALILMAFLVIPALCIADTMVGDDTDDEEAEDRTKIDVVFCLDSTGSMGSEIQAAKDKIWSIANKLLKGNPRPIVRFGVVTFRDKGDDYRVKSFDLSEDIDAVYKFLKKIQAGGGGDGPEDVRMALRDSLEKMTWEKDTDAVKMIFLVGDAQPHTDYTDLPSCEETAKAAIAKGISISSIACGGLSGDGLRIWKRIAKISDGTFQSMKRHHGGGYPSKGRSLSRRGRAFGGISSKASCDSFECAPSMSKGASAPGVSKESADEFEDAILKAVKKKAASKGVKF